MIKLLQSGGAALDYWDSSEVSWGSTGSGPYTLTHSKGKRPHHVICYYVTGGTWAQSPDLYWVSGASYGWYIVGGSSTINAEVVQFAYNPTNSTTAARFRLFFLPVNAMPW